MPGDYFEQVTDSRTRAQVGIEGWAADSATPANFTPPFRCDSYVPRSIENFNRSGFCDRVFERRIKAARAARGASADTGWHGVYDRLAQAAPGVPLVNRRSAVLVSQRVGNYQHHPLFGVLLDQLWVR